MKMKLHTRVIRLNPTINVKVIGLVHTSQKIYYIKRYGNTDLSEELHRYYLLPKGTCMPCPMSEFIL